MKTKVGEWKGGIWHPQVNNPKGFNRYQKNPNPVTPVGNQLQEFEKLTEPAQKDMISEMGNKIYLLTKEIRPLVLRFKKYKDSYDKRHFGWKWEE